MTLKGRLFASRRFCAWLTLVARVGFVLLLGASCLVAQGDWRCRVTAFVQEGLAEASSSGGVGELGYESPHNQVDVFLAGGREDDPFFAFLGLRAFPVSFATLCPGREFSRSGFRRNTSGVARGAVTAPHLLLITNSRQLLC